MLKYSIATKLILLRASEGVDDLPRLDDVEAWKPWSTAQKVPLNKGWATGQCGNELHERLFAEISGITGALEVCEATLTYGPRRWSRNPARVGTLMCLGKAFLLLCGGRWLQALECSRRGIQEKSGGPAEQLELHIFSAIALHHLAQPVMAETHIGRAEQVCTANDLPAPLGALMSCLRHDMYALRSLRDPHQDHAYWLPHAGMQQYSDTRNVATSHAQASALGVPKFIGQRLCALRWSYQLSVDQTTTSLSLVMNEIQRLRDANCIRSAHELCVDAAHAALIAERADWTEVFLKQLGTTSAFTELGRIELEYVISRCRALQGRADEAQRCYQRYVRMTMEALGRQAAGHPAFVDHEHAHRQQADAYEMRLPAKYRSIYRYIIANLTDPGLSVGSLAARAGVTERALQAAFKAYLGKTPSELIQNARLEQARSDMRDTSGRAMSVAEVGRKWGISRRSKLLYALSNSVQPVPETPRTA